MKKRTKKRIGKIIGGLFSAGVGAVLVLTTIKNLGNGNSSGTGTTTGLGGIGKLVGGGMLRGLAVTSVASGLIGAMGASTGDYIGSKIGKKKTKKKKK